MNLVGLYIRVLNLLGSETRLGWFLAFANVALAAAQFAEPVLFGRIIDALAAVQSKTGVTTWENLLPLLLAWAVSASSPSPAGWWSPCMPTGSRIAAAMSC